LVREDTTVRHAVYTPVTGSPDLGGIIGCNMNTGMPT